VGDKEITQAKEGYKKKNAEGKEEKGYTKFRQEKLEKKN
jgi:hypothetical protein